jgi:hypothetical protein
MNLREHGRRWTMKQKVYIETSVVSYLSGSTNQRKESGFHRG